MRQAVLLLLALAAAACGERPAVPPAAAPAAAPRAFTIAAGDFQVTALGERDGDLLHVRRLEVRRDGGPTPVQVIDGLQTDTPWTPEAPGLQAPDMNFDGHPDLRLIEFRAAGPNTPWRHWLFDPSAGHFVANAALDERSPTRYDAQHRLAIVDWRDGAERQGSDAFAWRDGTLQPATMPP